MSDILLSRTVEAAELTAMFRRTLPELPIYLVLFDETETLIELERPQDSGLLLFGRSDTVYPICISVWDMPGTTDGPVLTALAQHLSENLNCDAVCDGTAYNEGSSPYFSVLWRDGEAWLADDSDLDDAENPGPVRPTRRLNGPLPWLKPDGTVGTH